MRQDTKNKLVDIARGEDVILRWVEQLWDDDFSSWVPYLSTSDKCELLDEIHQHLLTTGVRSTLAHELLVHKFMTVKP